MSLRIDHGERMTLGLASALISPTHYMTAFLAQRGWRLPKERYIVWLIFFIYLVLETSSSVVHTDDYSGWSKFYVWHNAGLNWSCKKQWILLRKLKHVVKPFWKYHEWTSFFHLQNLWDLLQVLLSWVCVEKGSKVVTIRFFICSIVIPNIIPAVEPSESKPGEEKRVWRLAFFSRLEERKGLKMFVDAVNKLTANARLPTERYLLVNTKIFPALNIIQHFSNFPHAMHSVM